MGESLTDNSLHRFGGAVHIAHANGDALVIAEIKFREIPLQMLWADMVANARHATLQDRKITLNRVGMRTAANVLTDVAVHGFMAAEHMGQNAELAFAVRHERGLFCVADFAHSGSGEASLR